MQVSKLSNQYGFLIQKLLAVASAHCLRFSEYQYAAYDLSPPKMMYEVFIEVK
jgi:hypothetical protein